MQPHTPETLQTLKPRVRQWARELGFSNLAFAAIEIDGAEAALTAWLNKGYHGEMDYMARHGLNRAQPQALLTEVRSILAVQLPYQAGGQDAWETLREDRRAYVARYALGLDYHKRVRQRLQKLADRLWLEIGPFSYRAFSDSAPVMEVALAQSAGDGWRGKHTLLLNRSGSWFFLGELFTDLPFAPDEPAAAHCGTCQACIDICPTQAIVAPYQLDARRCISYLTIEYAGSIPVELRPLIGNRIYGCDDCQLACPWNRFASHEPLPDFLPRNQLDSADLLTLFAWSETEFLQRLAGSPIRRIGHERWLRNLAVSLGNTPAQDSVARALQARMDHPSAMLREHLQWAIAQHVQKPVRAPTPE